MICSWRNGSRGGRDYLWPETRRDLGGGWREKARESGHGSFDGIYFISPKEGDEVFLGASPH
jgi:hypothetical protein